MGSTPPKLRRDWPFRRPAVVLSGGGALGAYEVGVFKVLEAVGLKPVILAGVSVGAINAVAWVANGFRSEALERMWMSIGPSSIGMRWGPLLMRALSGFVVVFAVLQVGLTLAGVPALDPLATRFRRVEDARGFEFYSFVFEVLAWVVVGVAGYWLGALSRRAENLLARVGNPTHPKRLKHVVGWILIGAGLLFAVVQATGIPWPRRFHFTVVVVGMVLWFFNRSDRGSAWLRNVTLRLMPETGGRGLWSSGARRELVKRLVRSGDPKRLVDGSVHLIISACALDSGRMNYFVNWERPSKTFRDGIRQAFGDVAEVTRPKDVIEAAVAATAVPILFEPVRFRKNDYLDAGLFTNQPLHAVVADGADAILMVLVSPSSGVRRASREANVVQLGARLHELANWRDLQTELRLLPEEFSRSGSPAPVCVVEPDGLLPGALFHFDPGNAELLMRTGEQDAWKALERAGWLE